MVDQYLDLYAEARDLLNRHSAPLMNAAREEAFARLEALRGQRTAKREEAFRYTDVAAAFAPNYGLNLSRIDIPTNPYEAFKCDVPNLSTSVYFVINDAFNTRNLPTAPLPDGVVVDSLRRVAEEHPEWIEDKYDRICRRERRDRRDIEGVEPRESRESRDTRDYRNAKTPVVALNTLLAQDGIYIRIPAGVRVERPIQVVNILRSDVEMMVNRRVLIDVGEGAEATILVCDHTADDRRFLVTEVAEVVVGQGASLQLYSLEENASQVHRFTDLSVRQAAASRLVHSVMTLGTGLSCNRVHVSMDGEGAHCTLNGAVIADGAQHVDHGTVITHNAPGCESDELYKYVLDDDAVGAFAGRIVVPHGMQQTTSNMVNANLVGSAQARIYTQPVLEIYADDVQCSHGSTVGQLNDAALIYMRQRGIPEDEARLLLKQAFATQVIESIQLPALRDRLHHLVEKRFRGELTHCEGCRLCRK